MVNELRKAEEHLTALKQICVVACEEAADLEKAIATYRTRRSTSAALSRASAPAGTEALAVEWMNVMAPGGGTMLAAVARPRGAGPFPAVVILHGTHGFAQEYVRLARDLASRGVLAVAACWFAGSGGAGARFITPIACTEGPPLVGAVSAEGWQRVDALVQATRGLPGVRGDRIALFGHSRGAGAALNYSLGGGPVQAAVLNSSGYPPTFVELAARAKAPILMLHGTADSPPDGGSELTNVRMARDFEAALRAAGKPVESKYYEGGRHNGLFSDPAQYQDELQRIATFLLHHLQR